MGLHVFTTIKATPANALNRMRQCRNCGERYPLTVFSCEHCGSGDYAVVVPEVFVARHAA